MDNIISNFYILDEANLNIYEGDENVNEIHSSELPQPVKTSREFLPIQTKETVLNFEALKTFNVESPVLIVKHKKLGNKKTRKVLKRINVISKLKKKSKKQNKILEGVVDDHQAIPAIHVESLRSRRSSLDSQNIENQKIISESNTTDILTIKKGSFCDDIIFISQFFYKLFIKRPKVFQLYHIYI